MDSYSFSFRFVVLYYLCFLTFCFSKESFTPVVKVDVDTPMPVDETVGANVTLVCRVETGNPSALLAVIWYRDDVFFKLQPDCNNIDPTCNTDPSTLTLLNVNRAHQGHYSCRGKNEAGWGKFSSVTELIVNPAPSFEISTTAVTKTTNNTTLGEIYIKNNASLHYTSTVFEGPKVENGDELIQSWVKMDIHKYLKNKRLSFEFPFFGYTISNVTISTQGFLFVGDLDDIDTHNIRSTRYIAPLKGDFILTQHSSILSADNGTAFTVRWDNMCLRGCLSLGTFSFEATLMNNGDIIFIYKDTPVVLDDLKYYGHLVNVSLSYSHVEERLVYIWKQKIAYFIGSIELEKSNIRSGTVVSLQPLPSCLDFQSCDACLDMNNTKLKCVWCERTAKCLTDTDGHGQEWLKEKCDAIGIKSKSQCLAPLIRYLSHL